jgi:hypothetical protein
VAIKYPESFNVIVESFPLKKEFNNKFKKELLIKLEQLTHRKSEYNHYGLFRYTGAFSRTEKIMAITKFLEGGVLSNRDVAALLQGETKGIFKKHLGGIDVKQYLNIEDMSTFSKRL